jgi:hypothetical protein
MLLVLAMAATPALAETYKWVDAKGVVTYSDTPPPASATAQVVGDRISVLPPDPSLGPAVAAMEARAAQRAQNEEADYARRQQYLLQAQANEAAAGCYGNDCGSGYDAPYYYPYAAAGRGYRGGRRHARYVSHYEDLPTYADLPRYPGTRAAYRPGGRVMHTRSASFAGRGPGR